MKIDFSATDIQLKWRSVNDDVMGGRSSGGPSIEGGHLIFAGTINTDGGGFSSVRTELEPGELSAATGIAMRVKSDGRAYKITLKTDARHDSRPVSFQAPIATDSAGVNIQGVNIQELNTQGQWSDVKIPFSELKPSIRGRTLEAVLFDSAKVETLGIIIADGQDGSFRLEIDEIKTFSV